MFGMRMWIKHEGPGILLRPPRREEMGIVAEGFQSLKVHRYTFLASAKTLEDEQEWYDEQRKKEGNFAWVIVPDGEDKPVGVTGAHDEHLVSRDCTTGIIIWDTDWWGKRIATDAHLCRTNHIVSIRNLWVIRSQVYAKNTPSRKALERVGYIKVGSRNANVFRDGHFGSTNLFDWYHPDRLGILFPDGLPDVLKTEYGQTGLQNARKTLELIERLKQEGKLIYP